MFSVTLITTGKDTTKAPVPSRRLRFIQDFYNSGFRSGSIGWGGIPTRPLNHPAPVGRLMLKDAISQTYTDGGIHHFFNISVIRATSVG
jgi:hypothetical protein